MAVYDDDDAFLTTPELAEWLRSSVPTTERWRMLGIGPPYHKGPGLRSTVLYQVRDVKKWLADKRRSSTSDRGGE